MNSQPGKAPVMQLADSAREAYQASDDQERPFRALALAQAELALGRPSTAEPLLRSIVTDTLVGQEALRELIVLLARTERPHDAAAVLGGLDESPESRLVAGWLRVFSGDEEALERVESAGGEIAQTDLLGQRLLHEAMTQLDSGESQAGVFGWIDWLRDNSELDRYGVELPTAWVTALELLHVYFPNGAPRKVAEPLVGNVAGIVRSLPPGHPVRARGALEAAIAFGFLGSSTFSTMLIDDAYSHLDQLDPLHDQLIKRPVEEVWQHAGKPRRLRVNKEIIAITCDGDSSLLMATDLDLPMTDVYGALMRKSTSRQFLRALVDPSISPDLGAVRISVQSAGSGGRVRIVFPATQAGAQEFASILSGDEVERILSFADEAGIRPSLSEEVGRNDACPCGSGRKYKRCCGA